jgi:hypothetical protein
VRGDGDGRAFRGQGLEQGAGERRALFWIGPGRHLVEQHQHVRRRVVQDARQVLDVRAERGQRAHQRLLVADVGEHVNEPAHVRLLRCRDRNARAGHPREQTQALERHGLAARVRA